MSELPGVHPPLLAVREAVGRALAEDLLPLGDITASLLPSGARTDARLVARAEGVLAGRACATEAFGAVDPSVAVLWEVDDGSPVVPGRVVAAVLGPAASVLSAERTALNFLCHLSGVATLTRRFVEVVAAANPGTRILDTRKTTPGLRPLVKDSHLGGTTIATAVATARDRWPGRLVEVECDRPEQVLEAVESGAGQVLLDNMTPEQVAACVALVRDKGGPGVLVEISGGVSLETAGAFAAAGVDLISVGAITHSAPA